MKHRITATALLATLASCGGGGGGSSPATEPPSLSVASMAPSSGSSAVNPDSGDLTVSLRVHGYPSPTSTYNLVCGTEPIGVAGLPQWSASQERYDIKVSYIDLPGSSNCEFSGQLVVDVPVTSNSNTLYWSMKFTTAASQPLRYGPTLVGMLDNSLFAMALTKPYSLRIEPPVVSPPGSRAAPTLWLLGTALTAMGRVPVGLQGHGAGGPFAVQGRFNPVATRSEAPRSTDPFPANHDFSGSAGSFSIGSAWRADVGGVGPSPTATAKYWTSDGAGGWFYVESSAPDTLWQRDASGAVTQVYKQTGSAFGTLRVFSN